MTKVSVIIPVYGVEKYIERCARSLFEQTIDDIEYLFIDDCTPDKSIEVLLRVLEDYPQRKQQVIIYRMERNSGQAAVRTWGMKNATGDFIIHCDSDDWLEKDAYRLMYEEAIEEESDLVVCDFKMTDGNIVYREFKGCSATAKEAFLHHLLRMDDAWSLCNKLFRRQVCFGNGLIYPKGNLGEDMVMCIQLLLNAEKISYIPKSLYNYYYNPESITHTSSEEKKLASFMQNKDNAEILFDVLRKYDAYELYERDIVQLKWQIKKLLWSGVFDEKKFKLWKQTYPEINFKIFFSSNIPVKEKIRLLLLSNYLGVRMFRFVSSL